MATGGVFDIELDDEIPRGAVGGFSFPRGKEDFDCEAIEVELGDVSE